MRAAIVKFLLRLCAPLPLPLIHGFGVLIGWGLALIPGRLQDDTTINISLCFQGLSEARQRRLVRSSLIETGKALLETSALWLRPGPRALRLIRKIDGAELVERALEQGKGVILATPHLGSWEAAGLYGAAACHMTCLYRPLRIPEIEDLVCNARNRLGANHVPATVAGIRTLYRTLGQGGTVAMLPDQEPQADAGIFAPFFGIPAWTMVLLARLSHRSGAPVVFAWCERLARGSGYHLHFRAAPEEIYSRDTEGAVIVMNRMIEQLIRECPTQYQWGYRRFRTRPPGEEGCYDRRQPPLAGQRVP
jgi:KDO2-lipid IV(A) lauroyltransferase